MTKRIFISYSRRADAESRLAQYLHEGLRAAEHEVFVDTCIDVGVDWVEEIARRIAWCDVLILLLSRESVHSEMVLGEVRMAHRRRRRDGSPYILPIRVNYKGELDYELGSYLDRIQYACWASQADNAEVLDQILAAIESADSPIDVAAAHEIVQRNTDHERPSPGVGIPPGGTLRSSDPFYVRRQVDDLVEDIADIQGHTICIRAPKQMGKSSLLVRHLSLCHEAGKRFAFIDFQAFSDMEVADYPTLLDRLAKLMLQRLELPAKIVPPFSSTADFTAFVEDEIVRPLNGPLSLAFDEVDRILGKSYQGDFFSMLRYWHNRRAEPFSPWQEVDLALVIATEPHLLIDSKDRSPFNVATSIEPQPFDRQVLDHLNLLFAAKLTASELDDLHELVGGHPYLTRLAFYRLRTKQCESFEHLFEQAADHQGPFGDHLRSMLMLLGEQEGLLDAMKQVITHGSIRNDETYYRLYSAGLARRKGQRIVPTNTLYARFFRPVK